MDEFELRSRDGTALFGHRAVVDNAVGAVAICHGLGEHSARYAHVFQALSDAGWSAYAADLRGHGNSGGRRGHVDAWRQYVEDVLAVFDAMDAAGLADRPRILVGHSMGGLVSVHVALAASQRLAGLALSGPLLGIAHPVPPLKAAAGRLLSKAVPTFTMANEIDARVISHDPEEVRKYQQDPLVHDRVSARWFTEMNAALDQAQARASELKLPLLLMHGTADKLTDPAGSRRFLEHYGGPAESHFLDGFYHEVFNEVERQRPIGLLVDWLRKRAA